MPYVEIAPAPELASLVECYWRITGATAEHRVLPDGCIDILLPGGAPRAEVVGTMTRAIVASPNDRGVIGVRFRPGEASRLLPDAARELTDARADLVDGWSPATELEDALAAALGARDLAKHTKTIDAIFSRRLARAAGAVDLAVRAATQLLAGGAGVREVATRVALSERQLTRRFQARVGIPPKLFGRVMRLQRATAALFAGEAASNVAAFAGYADQAHFTRDASSLAGVTPSALLKERGFEMSDSFKTDIASTR